MSASIITDNLTKYYGHEKKPALKGLKLSIKSGEIYGYLGANGAGKSTTIRLLLNFLQPSEGSATILGLDSVKDSVAVKKQVGYLAGDVALYQKATGRQLLDYLSSLLPATTYRHKLEQRFEAELDKPIASLSKGNRQKIGIIQAFMHEPAVLILDEPSSGLDPLMQEAFYLTLEESKERGAAILMSSHLLDEAQRVCDRIGIIKQGKLVTEQTISDEQKINAPTFKVTFKNQADLKACIKATHLKLIGVPSSLTASFRTSGSIQAVLKEFAKYDIEGLSTETLDLENEFLDFYGSQE